MEELQKFLLGILGKRSPDKLSDYAHGVYDTLKAITEGDDRTLGGLSSTEKLVTIYEQLKRDGSL